MMNATKPVEPRTGAGGAVPVPTVGLLLAALQLVGILGYGLMLGAPGLLPLGLLAYAPAFVMILVVASAPRPGGTRGAWANALLPVTVGLVTVTMLVGTFVVPGSAVWWVVGAVASAAPFALLARAWSR